MDKFNYAQHIKIMSCSPIFNNIEKINLQHFEWINIT